MTTLKQRIRADGITVTAVQRDCPPPVHAMDPCRTGTWWDVTLTMDGRQLAVPFYMGSGHTTVKKGVTVPRPPDAQDVLACLLPDAGSITDYGMSDWIAEYFDDDSRQGRRIYQAVSDQTAKLRRFLGGAYDAYLYETDDA